MSKYSFPEWFIDELVYDDDKKKARDKILTSNDYVEFLCKKHGGYKQYVGSHIKLSTGERKSGCPLCANEKKQIAISKTNSKKRKK